MRNENLSKSKCIGDNKTWENGWQTTCSCNETIEQKIHESWLERDIESATQKMNRHEKHE